MARQTTAGAAKTRTRFPTVIRDPEQIVSIVKKDLAWVAVSAVVATAVAAAVYLLM